MEVKSTVFAILLTCLLTTTALAQVTTGSITGSISDPQGAVVAGATLKLVNTATGDERTGVSSSEGTFDFQTLQPGIYTISVEARGFKRTLTRDIGVSVASATKVEIP